MPLLIQNEMTGPTVINLRDHDPIILESKDDPNGADVARVPDAAHEDVNFMKALDAGMITIQSAPEAVKANLDRQQVAFRTQRKERAARVEASIDRQQNNDMVGIPCIGPNPAGRGACGVPVPVRATQIGRKPPLCGTHEHLSSQFVQSEDVNAPLDVDGKTPKKWTRVGMSADALPSAASV